MSSQYAGSESFPVDFTIPDDGDERDAAGVNVAFEALGDRTVWLRSRGVRSTYRSDEIGTSYDNPGVALFVTEQDDWSDFTLPGGGTADGNPYVKLGVDGVPVVDDLVAGDELVILVSGTWAMEGNSGGALRLRIVDDEDGVATSTVIPAARVLIPPLTPLAVPPDDEIYGPFSIVARHIVTATGWSRLYLQGKVNTESAGVNKLILFDALSMVVTRVRSHDLYLP